MCGFAGFLVGAALTADAAHFHVTAMAEAIALRGPDDAGDWCEPAEGLALAHRRLSILDLSPAGHQPMQSATGRYVIVFNGEIYNYWALRRELEAACLLHQSWRGHSDTETLLAAVEVWGLEATLQRCEGMFALALWDRQARVLQLARDRFGEKPLYYGWVVGAGSSLYGGAGTVFAFGSELKAMRALPGFRNAVCRQALAQYLRLQYVPVPRSIFRGSISLSLAACSK